MQSKRNVEQVLQEKLKAREKNGLIRKLKGSAYFSVNGRMESKAMIDFSSNDYLSLSLPGSSLQSNLIQAIKQTSPVSLSGSTGSRLLDGDHILISEVEEVAKRHHHAQSALLFNSGYDANVSLFSCIARKEDTIIYDELIHASVHDGMRLSRAHQTLPFKHNNIKDLESHLIKIRMQSQSFIFVGIESIYSMDGDIANIHQILELCIKHEAYLIIDEAHAVGIYGSKGSGLTLEQLPSHLWNHPNLLARVITLGKAMSCQGALVLGTNTLRSYLINYARPLIYSTAISPLTCISILKAYEVISGETGYKQRKKLFKNIDYFKIHSRTLLPKEYLLPSSTQIQAILIPGNAQALALSAHLQSLGYLVRAVRAPTVPKGMERIRICLRSEHNESQVISMLVEVRNWIEKDRLSSRL